MGYFMQNMQCESCAVAGASPLAVLIAVPICIFLVVLFFTFYGNWATDVAMRLLKKEDDDTLTESVMETLNGKLTHNDGDGDGDNDIGVGSGGEEGGEGGVSGDSISIELAEYKPTISFEIGNIGIDDNSYTAKRSKKSTKMKDKISASLNQAASNIPGIPNNMKFDFSLKGIQTKAKIMISLYQVTRLDG